MFATLGAARVTKAQWYAAGALSNPRCFRVWRRGWRYFIRTGA